MTRPLSSTLRATRNGAAPIAVVAFAPSDQSAGQSSVCGTATCSRPASNSSLPLSRRAFALLPLVSVTVIESAPRELHDVKRRHDETVGSAPDRVAGAELRSGALLHFDVHETRRRGIRAEPQDGAATSRTRKSRLLCLHFGDLEFHRDDRNSNWQRRSATPRRPTTRAISADCDTIGHIDTPMRCSAPSRRTNTSARSECSVRSNSRCAAASSDNNPMSSPCALPSAGICTTSAGSNRSSLI